MSRHHWTGHDDSSSACLACGLVVADAWLFPAEAQGPSGIRYVIPAYASMGLPPCEPADPSCATHVLDDAGACAYCTMTANLDRRWRRPWPPDPTAPPATCPGHEPCAACYDREPTGPH